jgi:hypothetical protein
LLELATLTNAKRIWKSKTSKFKRKTHGNDSYIKKFAKSQATSMNKEERGQRHATKFQ